MNIFFRELRANFKSLLIWSGIIVLFVIVGFSKFSAYYGNPELLAILDDMPAPMLAAFNLNAFNLTTISGFFGVMFAYFALFLSIAAVMWGSDTISKEERDKTIEFSLSLPVTRSKLITGKTLAALVNCIVLTFVAWAAILVMATNYEPDSEFYKFVALGMLALFIMELVFLAVGIFLGCAMKQHKRAGSVAVSVLLATYFIYVISGFKENLDFLKYFSPFKYFDPVVMLHESKIEPIFVVLSAGIILLALFGAYKTYARRDLYI